MRGNMEKYEVYRLSCKKCLHQWDEIANSTTEDRFVFTSRKNYLPSVVMFKDIFFKEISLIVDDVLKKRRLKNTEIAKIFHEVLGGISDPAPDGTQYSMMTDYICPKCGSNQIGYGPKNPPEFMILDLPTIPHTHWNSLDSNAKRELIIQILQGK